MTNKPSFLDLMTSLRTSEHPLNTIYLISVQTNIQMLKIKERKLNFFKQSPFDLSHFNVRKFKVAYYKPIQSKVLFKCKDGYEIHIPQENLDKDYDIQRFYDEKYIFTTNIERTIEFIKSLYKENMKSYKLCKSFIESKGNNSLLLGLYIRYSERIPKMFRKALLLTLYR